MRELKNGLYHAGWAIVTLLPVALFPNAYGFTVSGFLAGLIRETTEEQNKTYGVHSSFRFEMVVDALGSWRDLLGWTLGGLILGVGVEWVAG